MTDIAATTVAPHNQDQQQDHELPNQKVELTGKGMNRDLNSDMHAMLVKNDEPH